MSQFDAKAASWDADPVKVARAKAVAEEIRQRVPLSRELRAMEFGSGTGLLSFFLQPDVGHLTLVDSSTGMLEVAERKIAAGSIDNMCTLGLDLATDPLPGERFGLIYSLMTAHHVPDTVRLLRDLHALLEAGGPHRPGIAHRRVTGHEAGQVAIGVEGLDPRRRTPVAPADSRDRRRAGRAEEVHLSLHERDPARRASRSIHTVEVPDLLDSS